jgi:hypothetical protein
MISPSIDLRVQLLGLLSYPIFDSSMGYHRIKSVPTIYVMLSCSWMFHEHTPLYLLVWPMLSFCSHHYGNPSVWKSQWPIVEPISSILSSPRFTLNIKASVGNFCKHCLRVSFKKHMFGWKKWLPLSSCAFYASCRREFEKVVLLHWNHPKSIMHVQSILWFGRLITSIPYVSPSTPSHLLNWSRKRSSFLRAKPDLRKDFAILNDGSQLELGSTLL